MLVPQSRVAFGYIALAEDIIPCGIKASRYLRIANRDYQNLLPLLLRPLRLFFAPDSLRACRIALLKATHWPLVALILAYESGRRAVDRRRGAGQPLTASTSARPRSALMRRPLSTRSVQTRLNIKAASVSPPSGQLHTGQISHTGQQSRPQGRVQTLEALAANLREQLQAIDSLIASEKLQSYGPEA
jgi:hypothetical protein